MQVVRILLKWEQEAKKVPWLSDTHLVPVDRAQNSQIIRSERNGGEERQLHGIGQLASGTLIQPSAQCPWVKPSREDGGN